MIDPSWLADTLAGLVLAIALYCAGRIGVALVGGRRVELDADLTHILMGIGMAGMFVTRLAILDTAVWAVVFGLISAWFLLRILLESRHDGGRGAGLQHHAGHLASALAMLYMYLAVPTAAARSSMGGSSMGSMGSGMDGETGMGAHLPTLALLFALLLFGYAVLVADRAPRTITVATPITVGAGANTGEAGPGSPRPVGRRIGLDFGRGALLAPRGKALCEVMMSVAMGVMLIAML